MSADITLPAGAPEEVVTNALVRDIDLSAFGGKGSMALITLDNGHDHNRPNTFGPQSVNALNDAIQMPLVAILPQLRSLASHLFLLPEPIFPLCHF